MMSATSPTETDLSVENNCLANPNLFTVKRNSSTFQGVESNIWGKYISGKCPLCSLLQKSYISNKVVHETVQVERYEES